MFSATLFLASARASLVSLRSWTSTDSRVVAGSLLGASTALLDPFSAPSLRPWTLARQRRR